MTVPRQAATIFPREEQQVRALGARLRTARLRRRVPLSVMAARVGVAPKTLRRLERGDGAVGLALLTRTLTVLGLGQDLDQVAANDEIGQRLTEMRMPERARQPRARQGGQR